MRGLGTPDDDLRATAEPPPLWLRLQADVYGAESTAPRSRRPAYGAALLGGGR